MKWEEERGRLQATWMTERKNENNNKHVWCVVYLHSKSRRGERERKGVFRTCLVNVCESSVSCRVCQVECVESSVSSRVCCVECVDT